MKHLFYKISSGLCDCDIGMFHKFFKPPYGGSNQFFIALRKELTRRNFQVRPNCINRKTRAAIINSFAFDAGLLRKLRHDQCRIIHRVVGPVSVYRGTDDRSVDLRQWNLNRELADVTVFQSEYSRRGFQEMGLEFKAPQVIMNSVDPEIFFPAGQKAFNKEKVRIIATSWSNHPNKGQETYEWLDRNLDWSRIEFTFVGRIAARFRNIKVIGPVSSMALADIIRKHDIFMTASLHDTCSNSLLEALACGLPAVFADSGGNPEIVGAAGLGFKDKEDIPALIDRLIEGYAERRDKITVPAIEKVTDRYLEAAGIE